MLNYRLVTMLCVVTSGVTLRVVTAVRDAERR